MKKNNKNSIFTLVLLIIVIILVLLFPKIYEYIETLKLPKIESNNTNEVVEQKEVDEKVLESLHYPLMRNSVYNSQTYYTLDKFTVSDMSNNDVLYNAFLDIYEGNMTSYDGYTNCTTNSKQFNQDYIELRIKNILGKEVSYTLENFNVPEDADTSYVGAWNYDSSNQRFIYNGLCNSNTSSVKYYNLEQFIKAEYQDDDVIVYYYVGFAKVENNNYIIYSDALMQNEISSGTILDTNELNSLFEQLSDKDKKIYKYTFKNTLCSYQEYCLYEGEWVNEL